MAVQIGGVSLGEGAPKVIVPLTAKDADQLVVQATAALDAAPDLLEWRLDHLRDRSDAALAATGAALAGVRGATPVLATFRTAAEGGEQAVPLAAYVQGYRVLVDACLVDALDVEIALPGPTVAAVVDLAHAAGLPVVGSSHDFGGTPPADELVARLSAMATAGTDVCKVAVMPHDVDDVLILLTATARAHTALDRPLISVSMGGLGVVSRLAGGVFGSAATFGAVGRASAPGQVDAVALRRVVELVHEAARTDGTDPVGSTGTGH